MKVDELLASSTVRIAVGAVIIIALTLVVYIPAMSGGLIWDDDYWLEKNPVLQSGQAPWGYWTSDRTADYLPVTATFFWLQQQVFGENYSGYHVVNIVLHALGAVLLWRVLVRLGVPGAWLAGLIFAVHPVAATSAAWISEQKNTLSMVFYAMAILFYLTFDDSPGRLRWYFAAIVMFRAAALTKSSIIVMPVVLLGCVWWRHRRITWKDIWLSLPLFAVTLFVAVVTVLYQHGNAMDTNINTPSNVLEKLMLAGQNVWFYLYKALVPINLIMVYPRWDIHSFSVWRMGAIVMLLVTITVLLIYRRSWARPFVFALGYYFVGLAPVLGFFKMSIMQHSFVADHLQYLSLIGVISLIVGLGWQFASGRNMVVRGILTALALAVVAALSILTFLQAERIADKQKLWEYNIVHNENAFAAHTNLASVMAAQGRFAEAHHHYLRALDVYPDYDKTYNNVGLIHAKQKQYDKAIPYYQKAIRLNPRYAGAHQNLGVALANLKRYEEAAQHFQQALQYRFLEDSAAQISVRHDHLASALLELDQYEKAMSHFKQALQLDPKNTRAADNMAVGLVKFGDSLLDDGHVGQGILKHRQALAMAPADADRWFHVGEKLVEIRRFDEAAEFLIQADQLRPGLAAAHFKWGKASADNGELADAISHYRIAVLAKPDYAEALNNLAWILAVEAADGLRNGAEAVTFAERACQATGYRRFVMILCLSAAYAETGRREDAVKAAEKAVQLAISNGEKSKAQAVQALMKSYRDGKTYRQLTSSEKKRNKTP